VGGGGQGQGNGRRRVVLGGGDRGWRESGVWLCRRGGGGVKRDGG